MTKALPDDYSEMSHAGKVCTLMKLGVFDDDGWCGIRENAPDDVKKAYEELVAEEAEAEKQGIILD